MHFVRTQFQIIFLTWLHPIAKAMRCSLISMLKHYDFNATNFYVMANKNVCYKRNELEFCFTGHSRCKVFLEVTVPDETGSIHVRSILFCCEYMLGEVTVPNETGSIHIGSILFCYKYMLGEVTVPNETGSIHIGSILFCCEYMLGEVTVPNETGSIHIGSILFCYKYILGEVTVPMKLALFLLEAYCSVISTY